MLGRIKKPWEAIYSAIRNQVKSSYAPMVEEPSFDNTISKLSEKKSEEHLILLNSKARASDSSGNGVNLRKNVSGCV